LGGESKDESVSKPSRERRRALLIRGLAISILIGATWLMLEAVLWLSSDLAPLQFFTRRSLPPLEHHAYEEYMRLRDPVLGWPAPAKFGEGEYDESGARWSPAFPEPGGACVSLYGDSFVWGFDVAREQAWGDVLSSDLGCRVSNYGVPGYGVDQAFLRFRKLREDEAQIAVLVVFPDDIPRLLNQNRNLLFDSLPIAHGLKPRFMIGPDGQLELIPLPDLSYPQMRELRSSPGRFLKHEVFLPDGRYGQVTWRFPFIFDVVRILRGGRFRSSYSFGNFWQHFLAPSHPEHALFILRDIARLFEETARARGKLSLIVFLPDATSIAAHRENGSWPYQPALDSVSSAGVVAVNAGPAYLEYLRDRTICDVMLKVLGAGCVGHLTPEGNQMLARFMYRVLQPMLDSISREGLSQHPSTPPNTALQLTPRAAAD